MKSCRYYRKGLPRGHSNTYIHMCFRGDSDTYIHVYECMYVFMYVGIEGRGCQGERD